MINRAENGTNAINTNYFANECFSHAQINVTKSLIWWLQLRKKDFFKYLCVEWQQINLKRANYEPCGRWYYLNQPNKCNAMPVQITNPLHCVGVWTVILF